MCAKRTDKSSEDQKGTETQSAEQLADAPVEQVETATAQDATSEQGFALVLDDELQTEQNGDPVAQEEVQPQADDAPYPVHPAINITPTLEPNSVDVVEVLAVTSKSETGFYRAGLKFERLNAIPVEVLADGSGLVGDYVLTISQVQAIRDEPHLKCEIIHDGVTV